MVIKKSGDREEYDREKIEKSFHIACKKRPISEEKIQISIQNVEEKISDISNIEIEAQQVGELVMKELINIDKVAFIRFASVYRRFEDVDSLSEAIGEIKAHNQRRELEDVQPRLIPDK